MREKVFLEGHISVLAAVQAQSREIEAVYVRRQKWSRPIQRLVKTAESHHIPVQKVDDDFFEAQASSRSHGGVLAAVGPRRFTTLEGLLAAEIRPFVVMLDGIEDPFNFGQAIRVLYVAGVQGLVVRPRNWLSASGIVARASAGLSEWMPTAVADTAVAAAEFYKAHQLLIACTTPKRAISIYEADLTQPIFLLIGGEKRGITRSFMEMADMRLQIPYQRPFAYSLGAAASAAVLAFEVMRQRMPDTG